MTWFKRPKSAAEPVTVQQYTKSGKKEVVALESPEAARQFVNKLAKKHGRTPGVTVKGTPHGLTVEDADGKPVTHYNIEKD